MKSFFALTGVVLLIFAFSSCSTQEEKPAKPAAPAAAAPSAKAETKGEAKAAPAEKTPGEKAEKAKAEKIKGDVGLLDAEKNYLILVTKEGKLVTIDFDPKTKATELEPTPSKIADIGLGASAVVQYTKEGDKNVAASIEYKPAKGGD